MIKNLFSKFIILFFLSLILYITFSKKQISIKRVSTKIMSLIIKIKNCKILFRRSRTRMKMVNCIISIFKLQFFTFVLQCFILVLFVHNLFKHSHSKIHTKTKRFEKGNCQSLFFGEWQNLTFHQISTERRAPVEYRQSAWSVVFCGECKAPNVKNLIFLKI